MTRVLLSVIGSCLIAAAAFGQEETPSSELPLTSLYLSAAPEDPEARPPVGAIGYSARIRFTDGSCVRVSSGNAVDRACALAQ